MGIMVSGWQYPYDSIEETDTEEKTLRGSSQEIADMMKNRLQQRVEDAGLEVLEVTYQGEWVSVTARKN